MGRPDRYSEQLDLKNIGIKVGYWNKEIDRSQPPYLAEIQFFDGAFHYYYENKETHELELAFEESYEGALQFLKKENG